MTPVDIDRVFGRGRLQMVTGAHVEVFREASLPGERRRYTKRFLATPAGDFRAWTEREWRILARLVGHGVRAVPQVVQFDRGAADRPALVQTYDAGVTVDHWATLLPLERDGAQLRNVFEDCAHWWALARHCLIALDSIHALQLVHLDLKADNVCIPVGPVDFDPHAPDATLHARFDEIALIDFAFSLVSGEPLESALPIAQQVDYEYQSPRLLRALDAGRFGDLAPTRQLDWRCDLFSLAAMLWRHLPELEDANFGAWTRSRHAKARALVRRLIEAHDGELPALRPHAELIDFASEALQHPELSESLQRGWRLTVDSAVSAALSPTPVTRIAMPIAIATPAAASYAPGAHGAPATAVPSAGTWSFGSGAAAIPLRVDRTDVDAHALQRRQREGQRAPRMAWTAGIAAAAAALASVPVFAPEWLTLPGARHAPETSAANAPARAASPGLRVAAALPAKSAEHEAVTTSPREPAPAMQGETSTKAVRRRRRRRTRRARMHCLHLSQREASFPRRRPTQLRHSTPRPSTRAGPSQRTRRPPRRALRRPRRPPRRRKRSVRRRWRAAARAARLRSLDQARRRQQPRRRRGPCSPARRGARMRSTRPRLPRPARARACTSRSPGRRSSRACRRRRAPGAIPPHRYPGRSPDVRHRASRWRRRQRATASAKTTSAAAPASLPVAEPTNVVAAPRDLASLPAPFPAGRARDGGNSPPATEAPVDFLARANELMTHDVPRLAQQAERAVSRVLYAAARSERVLDDEDVRSGALAIARSADPLAGMTLLPRDAQQLNDAARSEYAKHGSTPEALMLQVRAFGANPLDAEIAGNLAFLLLRQKPAQPEAARQLALHALTLRGSGRPEGRIEDWATLAIASALSGRERDARNALLVTLALAPNLDRECKAALDVVALYGERLRAPVEAMLESAHASERARQSAFCEWPPHWVVGGAR